MFMYVYHFQMMHFYNFHFQSFNWPSLDRDLSKLCLVTPVICNFKVSACISFMAHQIRLEWLISVYQQLLHILEKKIYMAFINYTSISYQRRDMITQKVSANHDKLDKLSHTNKKPQQSCKGEDFCTCSFCLLIICPNYVSL